ncbi:CG42245 [Drosophila busckii]|uniref:CG42245 n=1 Tax=Drosophila busckii TaxID=30019 RepID=A0A0M4EY45_DROBS|nr:CG42245 [Drosophila busckii]
MSKHNKLTYIKQNPSFLAKLKAEIGYKEGPTVETKRQRLEDNDNEQQENDCCEERPEREDEKPQIVVLGSGDLTAEEVAIEQQRIEKEEAEKPADLSQPIVFKQRAKQSKADDKTAVETAKKSGVKRKRSKASAGTSKLSFNEDEEDAEAVQD